MLALGIGVTAGVFTILNAAAFRPLPIADSEQLVGIYQASRGNFPRNVYDSPSLFSYPEYLQYRDQNKVFTGLLAYMPSVGSTLGGVQPQQLSGTLTTCNYFEMLEVRPQLGRGFVDADCAAPGQSAVVVLSDAVWRGAFLADRSIIGRVVTLNRNPFVVVGIAAPDFRGTEPMPSGFWAPLTMQHALLPGKDFLGDEKLSWLTLLGRVKPGVPIRQVRANLAVIANHIDKLQPGRTTTLSIQRATLFGEPRERAILLGGGAVILCAVGLVLLIVCANIANLLLARATGRRREIALRLAIGAGRWRLVRQLVTESLLLAALGGVLGSLVAFWSAAGVVQFLVSHLPRGTPSFTLDIGVDVRVLTFALAVTLLTGVAFGLVPALQVSRPDLALALKDEGGDSEPRRRKGRFLRSGLVGVQAAVCTILLLTTGLLLRALYRAQTIDPGIEMNNITAASFDLTRAGYSEQRAAVFQQQLLERVAAMPGVDAVAEAVAAPLSDSHLGTAVSIPGHQENVPVEFNHVTQSYFSMLGIRIVRGRNFTQTEIQAGAPVTIITESTARRFWPADDPIGKTLDARWLPGSEHGASLEVVGVVKDARVSHLYESNTPYLYLPAGPKEQLELNLLVHRSGGSTATAEGVRAAVALLDPQLPVDVARLEDNLELWRAPARIAAILSAVLGALALVLASMGVFGMVSYAVGCRIREIGIRMALGADGREVTHLVLRQGLRPVAVGAAVGTFCAAGVSTFMSSLLYGISPHDPVTFATVPAFLLTVALLASYFPARRATKVDPMVALRYE
jgi:predicted permease